MVLWVQLSTFAFLSQDKITSSLLQASNYSCLPCCTSSSSFISTNQCEIDPLLTSLLLESMVLTWSVHSPSPDAHRQRFFLLFKSVYYSVKDPRSVPGTHMKLVIAAYKFRNPAAVNTPTILSNVYTHRETYKYTIQSKMKHCLLVFCFSFFLASSV